MTDLTESDQPPPPATIGSQTGDAPRPPMRDTHFDFEHKVFSLPSAFFCVEPNSKEPVLNILLGDLKAALTFVTLVESFQIEEGGHDWRLLEIVQEGLAYVKQIRPGEQIPGELLDGRASWSVEDRHRILAKGRLTMQIVSSFGGAETIVSDADQLEQILDDPQTTTRMKAAFQQIAQRLGIQGNSEQYLSDRIDDLAQELSYIEALRDRFKDIRKIDTKLGKLTQIYRTDRTLCAEINRMQGLIRKPVREYDMIFDQADAQTGDIVGALKDFHTTVQFIRKIRDEMRAKLLEWEDLLQAWDTTSMERSSQLEHLHKQTYRFLASRYIESKIWVKR